MPVDPDVRRAQVREAQARYLQTAKGKATQARYRATGAHIRNVHRYDKSPKAKSRKRARNHSERGKMLRFFEHRRRVDRAGTRQGYTGDAIDKALDAAARRANERVYVELREVERAGH